MPRLLDGGAPLWRLISLSAVYALHRDAKALGDRGEQGLRSRRKGLIETTRLEVVSHAPDHLPREAVRQIAFKVTAHLQSSLAMTALVVGRLHHGQEHQPALVRSAPYFPCSSQS